MKILITGATGFVGSLLCEKLKKESHQIYSLVRNEEKFKNFQVPGIMVKGQLQTKKPNSWVKGTMKALKP